jgi:transposase
MIRQVFDEDFKRSRVHVMVEQNKTVAQVARELDINPNRFHHWKKKNSSEFICEAFSTNILMALN